MGLIGNLFTHDASLGLFGEISNWFS